MATLFNPNRKRITANRRQELHKRETAEIPSDKRPPWHPTQVWENKQLME
jgi:hypothetical protein